MRVLVTGTRGFVGSILTQRLVDGGHEVVAVDNFDRGLNAVKVQPNLTLYRRDCRRGIPDLMEGCDAVVHLAAGTGSLTRPYEELVELNVTMTKDLYKDARGAGVPMFAFPMTSLSLDPELKDTPYVKSKQDGLNVLFEAQDAFTKVIPFMFFNQTGAYKSLTEYRKKEVHVGPAFIDCYLNKKPFIINGGDYFTRDGTPARDYTNIVNTVDFLIHTLQSNYGTRMSLDLYTAPMQLGTGTLTTTLELVKLFRKNIGPLEYEIGPRRAFDTAFVRCQHDWLYRFHKEKLVLAPQSFIEEWTTLLEIYLPGRGSGNTT